MSASHATEDVEKQLFDAAVSNEGPARLQVVAGFFCIFQFMGYCKLVWGIPALLHQWWAGR